MGRYANSRFRIVLLLVLLGLGLFAASSGFAEDGASANAQAKRIRAKPTLFSWIWESRDFVLGTILVCSVAGVTLIIHGFITNHESVLLPPRTTERIRELIAHRQFQELIAFTDQDRSFLSRALNPALKRVPSFASMKEAMETSIGEQTADQFRKIEYLNIIGNLGPLLGLMGTVYGMVDAFSEVFAQGGNASMESLAPGIAKALVHTLLGLMLAVPCLAAFGILRTIVDRLTVKGALLAEEMLLMMKPAESHPAPPPRPLPVPPLAAPAQAPVEA